MCALETDWLLAIMYGAHSSLHVIDQLLACAYCSTCWWLGPVGTLPCPPLPLQMLHCRGPILYCYPLMPGGERLCTHPSLMTSKFQYNVKCCYDVHQHPYLI